MEVNKANYYQKRPIYSPIAMTVPPSASESLTDLRLPTVPPQTGTFPAHYRGSRMTIHLSFAASEMCAAILQGRRQKLHLDVGFSDGESPWYPSLSSTQSTVPQSSSRLIHVYMRDLRLEIYWSRCHSSRRIKYVFPALSSQRARFRLHHPALMLGTRPGFKVFCLELRKGSRRAGAVAEEGKTVTIHFGRPGLRDHTRLFSCQARRSPLDPSGLDFLPAQIAGPITQTALSSGLYGCFTTLALAAFTALLNTILEARGSILTAIIHSRVLCDHAVILYYGPSHYGSCANTAALTVNILLGDSIVCWPVLLLWPGNLFIRGVSIILLLATLALGAVDLRFTCPLEDLIWGWSLDGNTGLPGGILEEHYTASPPPCCL
ncbi:hypothetical protein BD311DRAFT_843096 [Dichomitus squalens]|uniref:Uncharacterized protein n=1 Tax=Dichomitus squalens TaxID=114155 RepID=A0A4Q9MJK2_9APHY|nr:hypothetical protein BD311DRAFT_843096 [Dichomitus squalens]